MNRRYIEASNRIEDVYDEDAHEHSMEAWEWLREQDELDHETIIELHERIMDERQPDIVGSYRDVDVIVGRHRPPGPDKLMKWMNDLLEYEPETHGAILDWHVSFEHIHPFEDGNGRVGRMLYWWQCNDRGVETPLFWGPENTDTYYALFRNDGILGETPGSTRRPDLTTQTL